MIVLYAIFAAVVAELVFLIVYWLSSGLSSILMLGLSFLVRRPCHGLLHASFSEIATGLLGTFCAFAVALFIVRKTGMAEAWALFLGLGLPVIGEVQDFQRRFWIKHTGEVRAQGWPGRLNLVVKLPVQNHAYAMMLVQLGTSPDQPNIANSEEGRKAYEYSQWYLSRMFRASVFGGIIGVILAARWLNAQLL